MSKENYCSFGQAVKLKELGFDWKCYDFFTEEVKLPLSEIKPIPKPKNWNETEDKISAPRLDQAQKWLREEKRIHVEPYFVYDTRFDLYIKSQAHAVFKREEQCFDTYEQALSAGIDKALELLTNNTK